MTKEHRLIKAWQRNWHFYMHKGVYFIMGSPVKDWPTPKQLSRQLRKESRIHDNYYRFKSPFHEIRNK